MQNVNTTKETQEVTDQILRARSHYADQMKIRLFPELAAALIEARDGLRPILFNGDVGQRIDVLLARCRDV